ncbi:MAG: helix-turn-helix domain-containing protein, partial [Usitatibacteraceae bacterium]
YTQAMIAQVGQTAVCNRYHSIDQQLCRRLLAGLDRMSSTVFAMTQERLAILLGVRREGVTAAALKLQEAGAISYTRGRINVLDRMRLEQRTCECYAVAKREYDRLLPTSLRMPAVGVVPTLKFISPLCAVADGDGVRLRTQSAQRAPRLSPQLRSVTLAQ